MSNTPRTDDSLFVVKAGTPISAVHDWRVVHADFARQLERELAAAQADSQRLDWLERKHAESGGEHYLVECSITHNGNTGAPPLFPATRAAIDAARNHSPADPAKPQ